MPLEWEHFFIKPPSKIDPKVLKNMEAGMEGVVGLIGNAYRKVTEGIVASDFSMRSKGGWHYWGSRMPLKTDILTGANPIRVGVVDAVNEFPMIMKAMKQKVGFAHKMVFVNITENYQYSPAVWQMEGILKKAEKQLDDLLTMVFGMRFERKESIFYYFENMLSDLAMEIKKVFGIDYSELLFTKAGVYDVGIRDDKGQIVFGLDELAKRVGKALSIVTLSIIRGDPSKPETLVSGLENVRTALDIVIDYAAKQFKGTPIVPLTQDFVKRAKININSFYQTLLSGAFTAPQPALVTYKKIVELIAEDFDDIFSVKTKRYVVNESAVEQAA